MTFRLAPMSPAIAVLTVILLAIPALFLLLAAGGRDILAVPAFFMIAIYMWIWLRFRPTEFVLHGDALEIVWPLKRRRILLSDIAAMRTMNRREMREQIGLGMRVGAGGLWGAFGWLWTTKRGIVQMYISRTDDFVWIERRSDRPWLITPEQPDEFVKVARLSGLSAPAR